MLRAITSSLTHVASQPYDVLQIGIIEKAIRSSDLGLNPSNDGKLIRVPSPTLTEERRKELVKHLHHVAEDHRVAARTVRRDANEQLKKLLKDKVISEDDERKALDQSPKLTDATNAKIAQLSMVKEAEITKVRRTSKCRTFPGDSRKAVPVCLSGGSSCLMSMAHPGGAERQ